MMTITAVCPHCQSEITISDSFPEATLVEAGRPIPLRVRIKQGLPPRVLVVCSGCQQLAEYELDQSEQFTVRYTAG